MDVSQGLLTPPPYHSLIAKEIQMAFLQNEDTIKYPVIKCRLCGQTEQAYYAEETKQVMVKNDWCFTCVYWEELRERCASAQTQLSLGQWPECIIMAEAAGPYVYSVGPELPFHAGLGRGYGGSKFIIKFDDGRRMASSNLWSGMLVPVLRRMPEFNVMGHFVTLFDNGALEATNKEFKRLIAEGCYYSGPSWSGISSSLSPC